MTGLYVDEDPGWTAARYPDIREKPWRDQCGSHVPKFGYICDPSPKALIKKEEAQFLNDMVIDLAKTTKCKCQRRSQCMTKFHSDLMLSSDGASNQQQQQQLQIRKGKFCLVRLRPTQGVALMA
uniref:Uncharacterized protein n=1 Tax=Romanomermis culicivorax TaxID=13658 RepID=A0A915I6C8_ROMCU